MLRAWLPNIITLLNLLCGSLAVVLLGLGHWMPAVYMVLLAMIADFMDGLVARGLGSSNALGKELDSLADMVSFGFVPGLMYYTLLYWAWQGELAAEQLVNGSASGGLDFRGSVHLPFVGSGFGLDPRAVPAFLVSLLSAVRLAKFNLDTRQTKDFIGLATPSSALLVCGLLVVVLRNTFGLRAFIMQPVVLYSLIVAISYLLVAEWRLFSFKFDGLGWSGNEARFIFAILALAWLVYLGLAALPFIIVTYLLVNLVAGGIGRKSEAR